MEHVLSSIKNNVLGITLERLDKKNALTLAMYDQLADLLLAARDDDDIRVVTLTGGDQCFSAGNDLGDFLGSGQLNSDHPVVRFLEVIQGFNKPIIAGVGGYAVGIGTTMLMHCDLVYAKDNAIFQLPFVPLGLCPEAGASLLLPNLMGYQQAAELLLFGETFDVAKAHQFGLVNAIVEQQAIADHIRQRAEKLASLPIESVLETKRLLKTDFGSVRDTMVAEVEVFDRLLHSPTCQKIVTSLVNKK